MRLPVPGPRDVWQLVERGGEALEQLLGAVPRLVTLLDDAEALVARAGRLVDSIEETRGAADDVVANAGRAVGDADRLVTSVVPLNDRLATLLDSLEPSLTKLQPTLERLADTTSPEEVEALVSVVNHLPVLALKLETDIVPVLDSLTSVSPDLHDLLEVSRELNEMLAQIPGLSRMKKRIDERQAAEGRP